MVPTGISELEQKVENLVVCCRFPLVDPSAQPVMAFSERGRGYAEFTYDLDAHLYHPDDGIPRFFPLVYRALEELEIQRTTYSKGQFYPGMAAVRPEEFNRIVSEIVESFKNDLDWIRLFGRRVREQVDYGTFSTALAVRRDKGQGYDGRWLLRNWIDYIPYDVGIKFRSSVYKPLKKHLGSQIFESKGALYESLIMGKYMTREMPHIKDLRCHNGLCFYFVQPGGVKGFSWGLQVEKPKEEYLYDASEETEYLDHDQARKEIREGNLIFSREKGLFPYPGKPDKT